MDDIANIIKGINGHLFKMYSELMLHITRGNSNTDIYSLSSISSFSTLF